MDPVNLLQWGICKICNLRFASFHIFVSQGAAAHVRGAAENDAAAGGEQHAAAATAEL